MRVVKLVEYFVGDVGAEVMFKNTIHLSMIIFSTVIILIATSTSIILIWLVGKKRFSFLPCATKFMIVK